MASDHAGFALKKHLKQFLTDKGYIIEDFGTDSEDSVDYPDFADKAALHILQEEKKGNKLCGVLICGTGIGISIRANRYKGIRAALCCSVEMARLTREHNNANILCLGGRTTEPEIAEQIVQAYLDTDFPPMEKHERRINKLDQ